MPIQGEHLEAAIAGSGQVISGVEGGPGPTAVKLPDGRIVVGVRSMVNGPIEILEPLNPVQTPPNAGWPAGIGPGTPGWFPGAVPMGAVQGSPLTKTGPVGAVEEPPGSSTPKRNLLAGLPTTPPAYQEPTAKAAKGDEKLSGSKVLFYCNHANHIAHWRHENRFFTVPIEHVTPGDGNYQGAPQCPECGGVGNSYVVSEKAVPMHIARLYQAGVKS
jgi:hypothetical protein